MGQFSVVSVGAYLALAALSATISFRIYKSVLQAVQKTDEGHPFKSYLEVEIALSQDQITKYADKILLYSNTCMKELRRLFLVQDLVDSLKFAVLMWLLTYVGALFNGLTLLILAVVSMFSMPVVYEKHQAQIDQYVGLIRTQVNSVVGKIQAKIPGAKRKEVRVGNTGWMPCTNTGNLTETLMGLTWKLLGTPSRGDTFLSVTLVDSDDIDHLVLAEDVLHWHLLLKEVTSKVDLGGDIATVDLDLHQMSLLGFQWQKFHLGVSKDSDD